MRRLWGIRIFLGIRSVIFVGWVHFFFFRSNWLDQFHSHHVLCCEFRGEKRGNLNSVFIRFKVDFHCFMFTYAMGKIVLKNGGIKISMIDRRKIYNLTFIYGVLCFFF